MTKSPSELRREQIQNIRKTLEAYKLKDATVDMGNLYYCATELLKIIDANPPVAKGREFYTDTIQIWTEEDHESWRKESMSNWFKVREIIEPDPKDGFVGATINTLDNMMQRQFDEAMASKRAVIAVLQDQLKSKDAQIKLLRDALEKMADRENQPRVLGEFRRIAREALAEAEKIMGES